ncbi:glycosyltransferase family 4 protein [Candidatus Dependentiae bacterium]|nr:glycosyltransferase family 4 protein [Candidatus Dependentiae bacterium]MBU4387019.1 glycosyltransferase family 4 protein [Candidatus Dependentiae bacterium]MCG2756100.1 glycosyltransferase family 4 protein [Candidatus Dependentiae bacterium]
MNNKPNILIICTFSVFGGIEMHVLAKYKTLLKNGYNIFIVIPKNSVLEQRFINENLPYYTFKKSFFLKAHRQPSLKRLIKQIIYDKNIEIIHCNRAKEIFLFNKKDFPNTKIILTRHAGSLIRKKYAQMFDAIISVNQEFINLAKNKYSNIKTVEIPPFFTDYESLNFKPSLNKTDFFKQEFNIELNDLPIITQVASLSNIKNHQIFFYAASELINNKKKLFNIVLCGDGYNKKYLLKLAKKLNIEKYVYFLGFTEKRIEVIYHSDIKILTSKNESRSIVIMEAALLKKPLIGPTRTGVEYTIKHKKTGLLFENNNVSDLTKQIETLLDNSRLRKKYGENAYNHVSNNFTSQKSLIKLEQLYKNINF